MKTRGLFSIVLIIFSSLFAYTQTPQAFKYQTIVRNNIGEVITNQLVSFQVGIIRDSVLQVPSYYEIHTVQTNDFGMISLEIGTGTTMYGLFDTINWGSSDYHLEISLDENGGASYELMGTTQLLSVPYALYSENTINKDDEDWNRSGDFIFTLADSVGIGTSNPDAKLDVAGPIYQSETGLSVIIGNNAGINDDGSNNANVLIGYDAGFSNIGGEHNVFLGYQSAVNNQNGSDNTFIGWQSGFMSDADNNTFLGSSSGLLNQIGYDNVFIGESSGYNTVAGHGNTFVGYYSGLKNFTGNENVCIGQFTNQYNQNGINNTILGSWAGAGTSEHDKSGNVFLGFKAGYNEISSNKLYIENSEADSASALIYGEFDNNLLALNARVGIGTSNPGATLEVAGPIWQSGTGNSVFLGTEAGFSDDGTNNQNVFVGYKTGYANIEGQSNIFLGYQSGNANVEGNDNIFIGRDCSFSNTTGSKNIVIGAIANGKNQGGSNNVLIGYLAGSSLDDHSKSGNIRIGYFAGVGDTTNNKLYIENSGADSANALIYGEFDNNLLAFNANVGIKTTIPDAPLHIGSGTDATLSGGGYFVTGQVASTNLVIDDNEIIARNNGVGTNLFINREGGHIILNNFNGNVGIGTSSPAAKLHVNGAMRLGDGVRNFEIIEVDPSYPEGWSSLINYGGIGIGSNDGNNRQMFMFTDGSTTDNIFTVATSQNNGSTWEADLVIRQDGNVGINNTAPARKLHINDVMRLEPRASAPGSPSEGDLYVNSTDHHIYCFLNGIWKQLD